MKRDNEWRTPKVWCDRFRECSLDGRIALDPFPARDSWVRPRVRLKNGLGPTRWVIAARGGLGFWNPPYSRDLLGLCVQRGIVEAMSGAHLIGLLPSSTDVGWFHTLYDEYDRVILVRGRIKFIGRKKHGPLFPSIIVLAAGDDRHRAERLRRFDRVMRPLGKSI